MMCACKIGEKASFPSHVPLALYKQLTKQKLINQRLPRRLGLPFPVTPHCVELQYVVVLGTLLLILPAIGLETESKCASQNGPTVQFEISHTLSQVSLFQAFR